MGIPIAGPAQMFVDNNSVVTSVSTPESRLKKKYLSICYHSVREAIAAGIIQVSWIASTENLADLCTKILYGNPLKKLQDRLMVDYFEEEDDGNNEERLNFICVLKHPQFPLLMILNRILCSDHRD